MKKILFILLIFISTSAVANSTKMTNKLDQFLPAFFSNMEKTIVIDRPMAFSNNLVIPEYVTLEFTENGKLLFDSNEVIKINGRIKAGNHQIFQFSKGDADWNDVSSNIVFKNQKVFKPEWWGIIPDAVPNNIAQYGLSKQMMLDLKASNGGHLKFSEGIYYIRDIIIDFSNIKLSGKGDKTILKFDDKNFIFKSSKSANGKNVSTRQGGLFTIRGSHPNGQGNFKYTSENHEQISNITISNLKIEYTKEASLSDPRMNGLAVVNAKNVVLKNVSIDLHNANRAFYIGVQQNNEETENVIIKNCRSINSRTGVFITHGFPEASSDDFKTGKKLSNILIRNNNFNVSNYDADLLKDSQVSSGTRKYVDLISSGIYITGNDYTKNVLKNGKNFHNALGRINIENNTILNSDVGIRSSVPYDQEKHNRHILSITQNEFLNFKYFGVFGAFNNATIKNNIFNSNVVKIPPKPSSKNHATFFTNQNYCINIINKIKNKTDKESDNIEIIENDLVNFSGYDSNINTDEIVFTNGVIASL